MVNISFNYCTGIPHAVLLDSLVFYSSILSVWLLSNTTNYHWSFCYFKILKGSTHCIYENLRKRWLPYRWIFEIYEWYICSIWVLFLSWAFCNFQHSQYMKYLIDVHFTFYRTIRDSTFFICFPIFLANT